MKLLSGKNRQAIFVFDGHRWCLKIMSFQRRRWTCIESVVELAKPLQVLPEELLAMAVTHSAVKVKILQPCDVHNIEISLPEDLDDEEIQTALVYELASNVEHDPTQTRAAATRASSLSLGAAENQMLIGTFSDSQLEKIHEACTQEKLKFAGIGSLELAFLQYHGTVAPSATFVLLYDHKGIYVSPGHDLVEFSLHTLGFGSAPSKDSNRDREKIARFARLFSINKCKAVKIYCASPLVSARKDELDEAFGIDADAEYVDIQDVLDDVVSKAALSKPDKLEGVCSLVSRRKPPKPPYRAGTWMFCAIIFMTLLYIVLRWWALEQEIATAKDRAARWKKIENKRESLQKEAQSLRDKRDEYVKIIEFMKTEIAPFALKNIFIVLSENIPPYTHISAIKGGAESSYTISGYTKYQEGLIQLNHALKKEMNRLGLQVRPGDVKPVEGTDSYLKEFVFYIEPIGGR